MKGYTLEDLETMPQRIASTTYDQSTTSVRKFLSKPPYTEIVYTPEDDYGWGPLTIFFGTISFVTGILTHLFS